MEKVLSFNNVGLKGGLHMLWFPKDAGHYRHLILVMKAALSLSVSFVLCMGYTAPLRTFQESHSHHKFAYMTLCLETLLVPLLLLFLQTEIC